MSKLRVGIVGLHAGRSWAARAHLPALRAMPDVFEVVGVANASRASSEAAAAATSIPRAFDGVAELVASPDIDIVAITVKVPHHLELAKAALEAGKHVFCEWPLGNGLEEAKTLAALAKAKGVLGVVGTQARVAPEIMHVRKLVADGTIGDLISSTITAWGGGWGASLESEASRYLLDRANGATMLTIPVGHTLAAVRDVLGEIAEVSAVLANRRPEVKALDTGNVLPKNAADQVLLSATFASGAPLSLHYRGGMPPSGPGLVWEINGSRGDLRITAPFGHTQLVPLTIEGLEVSAALHEGFAALNPASGNVARMYARMAADLRDGTRTAPSFDDAVELHRVLDAIETSAASGQRVAPAIR